MYMIQLIRFNPMFHFYNLGFLTFLVGMRWKIRPKLLIYFWQMFLFYTPWKHQETKGFLVFSGVIKLEYWPEIV